MDSPRVVRAGELPAVIDLVKLVFDDPAETLLSMPARFPHALSAANLDNLYALFDDGRPVSVIGTQLETLVAGECRIPVATLGMVCTHADYRGRQLAGQVLEASYDGVRRKGAAVVLISGWRTLYTGTGGARVWPQCEVKVEQVEFKVADDAALAVERIGPGNRDELLALHDAEPVRFEWPQAWRDLVLPGLLESKVGTGLLIRRAGRAVAAAVVLNPPARSWPHMLLDWFGDRRAAVVAVARLKKELGIKGLRCIVSADDTAMVEALTDAGLPVKRLRPSLWTIKVLDFARLLEAVGPQIAARLAGQTASIAAAETGLCVRAGGCEYVTPDEPTATRLIFASPEDAEEALRDVPPPVRDVLRRVFPVPLRHYGVNYL